MARRLLLTYLTITALTLAVVVIPLGQIFAKREHDRLAFDIERDAQNIASLVEDNLEEGTTPSIGKLLNAYQRSGGRIVVVTLGGLSVADSKHISAPPRDFSTRPEIAAALDGERNSGVRNSSTLGAKLIYVAVPVASGGVVHGAVRVTYPMSTLDSRVASTWRQLGLLSVVVLAIVAVVGVVIARSVSRPVRDLEAASNRLAAGDLSSRVRIEPGAPELGSLANTFNSMADRLEEQLEVQRRFVADASHQLRTPLTAMRLRLETLGPYLDDSAQPKLQAAIRETDRLAELVHSLLILARGDSAGVSCDPLNLSSVVSDRVETWEPTADERQIRLVQEVPSGLWAEAMPGAVEQILDNLISNSLDALATQGTIVVRVLEAPSSDLSGDAVEIHVIDDGPGMSQEERDHAFERFWRTSHQGTAGRGGFGLGLAIVEQLTRRCEGRVKIDSGPNGVGLDVVVALPATTGSGSSERQNL